MLETGDGERLDRGATLLEVLVVLAILGLTVGIGFPRLQNAHLRLAAEADRDQVAADLRSARALAIRSGRRVTLEINEQGAVLAWGDHRDRLPEDTRLVAQVSPIRFDPDGSTATNQLSFSHRVYRWPGLVISAQAAVTYER